LRRGGPAKRAKGFSRAVTKVAKGSALSFNGRNGRETKKFLEKMDEICCDLHGERINDEQPFSPPTFAARPPAGA
jgi:hypothetical protein